MASSSSSSNGNEMPAPPPLKKRKAGRKKFHETRHPVFKGVRQRNGKWVCELRAKESSSVWVGTFSCAETAARAYDVAAVALKGESATLNFPELACSLPRVNSSSSLSVIRRTAAEAAEAFSTAKVSKRPLFVDEEELFNMPGIIAGIAEGMILTPPGMQRGFDWDGYETTSEFSLWSD